MCMTSNAHGKHVFELSQANREGLPPKDFKNVTGKKNDKLIRLKY